MPRRGVQVSADELFDYTTARSTSASSSSSSHHHRPYPSTSHHSSSKRGTTFTPSTPRPREQFVSANYTFAIAPPSLRPGQSAPKPPSPDRLDWSSVDLVFTPSPPPDCPICLCPPRAPRITRCGHILDHVCALQLLHHAALAGAQPRCPLCADALDPADLRFVAFLGRAPPKVRDPLSMRLVARPRYSHVPRVFCRDDRVQDFELLPQRVTPGEPFFSRLVHADEDYLLGFVAAVITDLEDVLREDASLRPFVNAAKGVAKEQREAFRLRRRRRRRMEEEEAAAAAVAAAASATTTVSAGAGVASEASAGDVSDRLSLVASSSNATSSGVVSSTPSLKSPARQRNTDSPPPSALAHDLPGMYVFFQAADASHVYLHPVCHRIVAAEYAPDFSRCPPLLERPVLQIDNLTMDEPLRKRYRFLAHLPLGCEFSFAEVDMTDVVSPETLAPFAPELAAREAARTRRAVASERENRRIAKEETKSLRTYFSMKDDGSGAPFGSGLGLQQRNATVDSSDIVSFPPIPFAAGGEHAAGSSSASDQHCVSAAEAPECSTAASPPRLDAVPTWGAAVASYSAATSNMGVFPSLNDVVTSAAAENATADVASSSGSGTENRVDSRVTPGLSGTRMMVTPSRIGAVTTPSVPGGGPPPGVAASPPRGAWAESPPRGMCRAVSSGHGSAAAAPVDGAAGQSHTPSGGGGHSPPRGRVPPYPRRGRKQITVLSTAGPQYRRR